MKYENAAYSLAALEQRIYTFNQAAKVQNYYDNYDSSLAKKDLMGGEYGVDVALIIQANECTVKNAGRKFNPINYSVKLAEKSNK